MLHFPCSGFLFFTVVCLSITSVAYAQTNVLLNVDFQTDHSLRGWKDCGDMSPPDTAYGVAGCEVEEGRTNYFYRGLSGAFGVSATLDRSYRVDQNTLTVEILARVRNNGEATPAKVDLSSREYPAYPFQFSRSQGSGFGVGGYQYNNHVNQLYFYIETETPESYTEKRRFTQNAADWHQWRTVYDHQAGTLSHYVEGAADPVLVQQGVKLSGVEFKSLWFMGGGADYDDIRVWATTTGNRTDPKPAGRR